MHPILFELGPITIYTYGFFVFLGVIFGYYICLKEAKRSNFSDTRIVSDIIFWALVFAFLGARVFYILIEFKSFLNDPWSIITSRSGFVFYGGVIFGLGALYYLTRKHGVKFLAFADIVSIATPLAHAFGRIGCFFYGCCYGKPTDSFIGVVFPVDSPAYCLGRKVIPTQLIESFLLFVIFFIMLALRKRKKFDGQLMIVYLILYGITRFAVEFLRGDPRGNFFFLSTSQIISIIIVIVSIFSFRFLAKGAIKTQK
ncbi:MAG: prolipoprotein diacylglyceryl transferase [Candidatus Omnitrophica bacterium]|nr:prolipoprotein diacylglyceryl transferase [Candidatus Omnitrophota bacterium]